MKHVRVRITADGREKDIHPMYGVITEAPFVNRATAIQWNYSGDTLGILHYVVGDANALETAVGEISEVESYAIKRIGNRSCYVYVQATTTDSFQEIFSPIFSGGLVVVPPVKYEPEGTVTFSMFGPDDKIQDVIKGISDQVNVTIEAIGGLADTVHAVGPHLTERQHAVVARALKLGYYEIPRTATQEEIAVEFDCEPGTIAEHLRKAESKLVRLGLSRPP